MWMMGYNDHSGDFNLPDSINGRRFRPLIPRPASSSSSSSPMAPPNTPCLARIHHESSHDLLALNHHLAAMAEQNKREFINTQQVVVSSRWNPTPEQLQTLEELYRRGTRTPSADQIQQITAQLRRYGKIEGKNVFYWFQNHKARERQKRRRQLESASNQQSHNVDITETTKDSTGANRTTGYEVEQTKHWPHLTTNCSTLADNLKSASIQRAAKAATATATAADDIAAGAAVAECRTDGWVQFEERELQHQQQEKEKEQQQQQQQPPPLPSPSPRRRSLMISLEEEEEEEEGNATWQMMHNLSCSPSTHLIINPSITNTITTTTTTNSIIDHHPLTSTKPNLMNNHHLNIFMKPYTQDLNHLFTDHDYNGNGNNSQLGCGGEYDDDQMTLQLFPLRSGEYHPNEPTTEKEAMRSSSSSSSSTVNFTAAANYQFFEFLPLKKN